jgi:hypothetical protein
VPRTITVQRKRATPGWAAPLLAPIICLLVACGAEPGTTNTPSPSADPLAVSCKQSLQQAPVRVLFLAKEAVQAELAALTQFVNHWTAAGCFSGKVVTSLKAMDLAAYQVMVVDISHDASLDDADVTGLVDFVHSKRHAAVFDYALRLSDQSRTNTLLGQETQIGRMDFSLAPACTDWQYGSELISPFDLSNLAYHYPAPANATYAMRADGPSRPWATLTCAQGGVALLEVPTGAVAGFYGANALAQGGERAGEMEKLVADVVQRLSQPSSL